jgi:DNA-binding phage protein
MTGMIAGNGRAHPLVCDLFSLMREQRVGMTAFAKKVGVSRSAFKQWRDSSTPNLGAFVAVANALGYEVVLRPKAQE